MALLDPVGPGDEARAVELLAGYDPTGRRTSSFSAMIRRPGRELWCIRGRARPRVVALAVQNPGRVATLYLAAGRASAAERAELMAHVAGLALAGGAAFVQAVADGRHNEDAHCLLAAGFEVLSHLVYLCRGLGDDVPPAPAQDWPTVEQVGEQALGGVILDTYRDSLDCRRLHGLRSAGDIIASHKASGTYSPRTWFVPHADGGPVGCLLINAAAGQDEACDVVYLGVRPEFRRMGWGGSMLRRGFFEAAARGWRQMYLAVDAANEPAVRLYRREGFETAFSRDVYVCVAEAGRL